MSGEVCTCSGFGVLLGREWYFGSFHFGISFGGGFWYIKNFWNSIVNQSILHAGFINWLSLK